MNTIICMKYLKHGGHKFNHFSLCMAVLGSYIRWYVWNILNHIQMTRPIYSEILSSLVCSISGYDKSQYIHIVHIFVGDVL